MGKIRLMNDVTKKHTVTNCKKQIKHDNKKPANPMVKQKIQHDAKELQKASGKMNMGPIWTYVKNTAKENNKKSTKNERWNIHKKRN